MHKVPGLAQLDEFFRQFYREPNVLTYDPFSDLTFIYGDHFQDLIDYLKGTRAYQAVNGKTIAMLIHERQHYIDFNHSPVGLREIKSFDDRVNGLAGYVEHMALSGDKGAIDPNLRLAPLGLFYDTHLNRAATEVFQEKINPQMVVGLQSAVSAIWHPNPQPVLDRIEVEFTSPGDGSRLVTITVSPKSIFELSALGAQFNWRWSVGQSECGNQQEFDEYVGRLEEELFMLVHDFSQPDYIGAFHASHAVFRKNTPPNCTNFPLIWSLMYGGALARAALYICGTDNINEMRWHPNVVGRWGNTQEVLSRLDDRLIAVFYNLAWQSQSVSPIPTKTPADWVEEVLQYVGLTDTRHVLRTSTHTMHRIGNGIDEKTSAGKYFIDRIFRGIQLIDQSVEGESVDLGSLMFFDHIHPIDWGFQVTNEGQPVLIRPPKASNDEVEMRVNRGLSVWVMQAAIKNMRSGVLNCNPPND